MKTLLYIIFLSCITFFAGGQQKTLYDFTVNDIDGNSVDLSRLKGKKVLIVNTASKCSLAPQLKKLQKLYEEYGGVDFEIIAFPSNDFGKREPASNEEVKNIYSTNYNISFLIMEKIHVKGDSIHPVYQWLTSSEENGVLDKKVLWNFQKYLIEKDGTVYNFFGPTASPNSNKIIEWILAE